MPPILRWIIGGALCCALVARPAWAGGPDDAASTARNWQFWTSASLLVPTPVGVYAPDTAPSPPGLGLTALFRSPGGAWSARASLDVSRYRASLGNVSYTMFFAGLASTFDVPLSDATDLVWALAGVQREAKSSFVAPRVHLMAGVASMRTRVGEPSAVQIDVGLREDRTLFAAAAGGGIRWPIDKSQHFALTADADYRWTAPINYVTSPATDASDSHLESKRSSIEVVTAQVGLAARWGGY